ncbi:hypothetical protein HDV05_008529 [Chytridiales sp. JEL 0842]|nr:hypothetical protein HDV05_008529 [Chytridiales sp. JEL 0842]
MGSSVNGTVSGTLSRHAENGPDTDERTPLLVDIHNSPSHAPNGIIPTSAGLPPPSPSRNAIIQVQKATDAAVDAFEQTIVVDDDLLITIIGFRVLWHAKLAFNFLSFISFGIFALICRWFPLLEVKMTACRCPLSTAEFVLVKNQWDQVDIIPVCRKDVDGVTMSSVFPPISKRRHHHGDAPSSPSAAKSPVTASTVSALGADKPLNSIHGQQQYQASGQNDSEYYQPESLSISAQPLDRTISKLVYFDYRYIKFFLNPSTREFQMNRFWRDTQWTSVSKALEGVDGALVVSNRLMIFGENAIVIEEKPTLKLLFDEVLHPFFVFQIASMILWSLDEYYYYAACIFVISVVSTVTTLVETKEAMKRLRDISKFSCNVRVWRGGVWWELTSEELVPGDVFEVPSSTQMPMLPCDAILLDGDCIVNESMLTGESIPVSKTPISDEQLAQLDFHYDDPTKSSRISKFFLFSGTRIIRSRAGQRAGGIAPSDSDSALHFGTPVNQPNALALVVRTGFNTAKIEEGGSTWGGAVGNRSAQRAGLPNDALISMVVRPPGDVDFLAVMQESSVNGSATTSIASTKTYTELGVVRSFDFVSQLRRMSVIIKRLRFSHTSLSMPSPLDKQTDGIHTGDSLSPVANAGHGVSSSKEFEVFVKGAPEVMRSICLPSSIPANYDDLLRRYAHRGYRVIACASKKFERTPWTKIMRLKRDDVEKDLHFLGFIVFENKLKPGTADVVDHLNKARIRQLMCTGDNILTAVSVSRDCGLVNPKDKVLIPVFKKDENGDDNAEREVLWEDIDGDESSANRVLYSTELLLESDRLPLSGSQLPSTNGIVQIQGEKYHLAVTGDVFQHMIDFSSTDLFHRLLMKGQIFARMSPEQKHLLVERLQDLGYCVGFCGDGANDCGALKAADVGISLSEAEASVAAPFTSRTTDLYCVLRLIKEGRAALTTSFGSFKFMAVYSMIQFTSVSLLYALASNLADFQFLLIDLGLIIPIAVFMAESGPADSLVPKRPTASLVSKKVLCSMLGQVGVQALLQVAIFFWVRSTSWYVPTVVDVERRMFKCHENTAVFLLSCYQYVAVAIVFCVGPPYRESTWANDRFVFTATLMLSLTFMITMWPTDWLISLLDLMPVPFDGRLEIMGFVVLEFVMTIAGEKWIFPLLAKLIGYCGLLITEAAAAVLRRRLSSHPVALASSSITSASSSLTTDAAIRDHVARTKEALKFEDSAKVPTLVNDLLQLLDESKSSLEAEQLMLLNQSLDALLGRSDVAQAFSCFKTATSCSSSHLQTSFTITNKVKLFNKMVRSSKVDAKDVCYVAANNLDYINSQPAFTGLDKKVVSAFLRNVFKLLCDENYRRHIPEESIRNALKKLPVLNLSLSGTDYANISYLGSKVDDDTRQYTAMVERNFPTSADFFQRRIALGLRDRDFNTIAADIRRISDLRMAPWPDLIRLFSRYALKKSIPPTVAEALFQWTLDSNHKFSEELLSVCLELAIFIKMPDVVLLSLSHFNDQNHHISPPQLTRALLFLLDHGYISESIKFLKQAGNSSMDNITFKSVLGKAVQCCTAAQLVELLSAFQTHIQLSQTDLEAVLVRALKLLRLNEDDSIVSKAERKEKVLLFSSMMEVMILSSQSVGQHIYKPMAVELAKLGESEKLWTLYNALKERDEPVSFVCNLLVQAEVRIATENAEPNSIIFSDFKPLQVLKLLSQPSRSLNSSSMPDIWAWNEVLAAVAKYGLDDRKLEKLLMLIETMSAMNISPDIATYTCLLNACQTVDDVILVEEQCVSRNILLDNAWFQALISKFAAFDAVMECERVFVSMYSYPTVNVVVDNVNTLIEAFGSSKNFERAMEWYRWAFTGRSLSSQWGTVPHMRVGSLKPNSRTLNALISASNQSEAVMNKLEQAYTLIDMLKVPPSSSTSNLLIWAAMSPSPSEFGQPSDSLAMKRTSLLNGEQALYDMVERGIVPSKHAFVSLIAAAGRVANAKFRDLAMSTDDHFLSIIDRDVVRNVSSDLVMEKAVSWTNNYENLMDRADDDAALDPYLCLIDAFASIGDVEAVKLWRQRVIGKGPISPSISQRMIRSLVKAFVARRDWSSAISTVERLAKANNFDPSLWNMIASGYLAAIPTGWNSSGENVYEARLKALECLTKISAKNFDSVSLSISMKVCSWKDDPWLNEALLLFSWATSSEVLIDFDQLQSPAKHTEIVSQITAQPSNHLQTLSESTASLLIDTFTFAFKSTFSNQHATIATHFCNVWTQLCHNSKASSQGPDLNVWNSLLEAICRGMKDYKAALFILCHMGGRDGVEPYIPTSLTDYNVDESLVAPILRSVASLRRSPHPSPKTILSTMQPIVEEGRLPMVVDDIREVVSKRWPKYLDIMDKVNHNEK